MQVRLDAGEALGDGQAGAHRRVQERRAVEGEGWLGEPFVGLEQRDVTLQ